MYFVRGRLRQMDDGGGKKKANQVDGKISTDLRYGSGICVHVEMQWGSLRAAFILAMPSQYAVSKRYMFWVKTDVLCCLVTQIQLSANGI